MRQVSIDSEEQAKTETLGDASRLLLKDSGGFRWHDFGRGHVPEPKPAIKQSWGDPIPMFQMGRHGIALVPTAGKHDCRPESDELFQMLRPIINRTEERSVGKECVSSGSTRGSPNKSK